jgi:phosphatidylinositol alpha-1,6-mannosyltransferase
LKYHIIGTLQNLKLVNSVIQELNVDDHVIIHGPLKELEKLNILCNADVAIMLSETTSEGDFEGFGIALLEANFMGLPTIGSQNSGIEDAIISGFNGVLVNPHDPDEIAKAVDSILNNYLTFSKNAHKFAEEFLWKKVIKKYLEVI